MSTASMHGRVVAFIPARAGSKGVKGKNVRVVGGKPLIVHTLECALACPSIAEVVVTTDCADVRCALAAYSIRWVERPAHLAQDDTPTSPAIAHALAEVGEDVVDIVLLLQCTSPLREPHHVEEALRLFEDPAVAAVNSVVRCDDDHPGRTYRMVGTMLEPLHPEWEQARRQDLPPMYRRNGAIYAIRREAFRRRGTFIGNAAAYEMPAAASINIDSELDLLVADHLLSTRASD